MLDALQKIGMRFRRNRQRWATEILKATKGEDLTRLKAYVDDGGVLSTPQSQGFPVGPSEVRGTPLLAGSLSACRHNWKCGWTRLA